MSDRTRGVTTSALLVIDAQHDYLRTPASADLIERVRALVTHCRSVGVPVVHVWTTVHRAGAPDDNRMPHWRHDDRWMCVEGTPGHTSPIAPLPDELVVHKQFFSAFGSPALDPALRALGVETIWLCGVQMQSCIRATAMDAYQLGYQVELRHDAIGTEDAVHAAMTQRYLATRLASAEHHTAAQTRENAIAAQTTAAQSAWRAWRTTTLDVRRTALAQLADAMDVDALAQLVSEAVHKPIAMARGEVSRAVALVRLAARDEPLELPAGPRSVVRYPPRGVVAVITPYNNPVAIPLGRLAPALFYGNTVVWKPSPAAARVSDALHTLIESIPALRGLVHVVHGGVADAERVMADAQVDAVVLTGSESAGTMAQVICAQRAIPLQAELGGNNAAIVCADADLDAAARAVADGAFGFAGQRCTANRRVIVERSILAPFLATLTRALPDPGLLISEDKATQVRALIARTPGLLAQGPAQDDPRHVPATVFLAEQPQCEIVQEETFGPVLVVQPADDLAHALALLNGVRQGLVAALFSTSAERQAQFLDEAQAGILKLNQTTADADAEAPFGGWKASGVGPPEHGRSNREVFTRTQAVYR
jgi:acyl-CoA reductase-like NAD-dependent aldehyde dehydrogenase